MAKNTGGDTTTDSDNGGNESNNLDAIRESDTISSDSGGELSNIGESDNRSESTIDRQDSSDGLDPAAGIDTASRKPRRERGGRTEGNGGRGTGTNPGSSAKAKTLLKDGSNKTFATQLVGLHAIAGIITGQPQICAITPEQSEAMVLAVSEVMAQYKIKPNPKVAAWAGLAGVMGMIYIPKIMLFRAVAKAKRSNISPINRAAPSPAPESPAPAASGMRFG